MKSSMWHKRERAALRRTPALFTWPTGWMAVLFPEVESQRDGTGLVGDEGD